MLAGLASSMFARCLLDRVNGVFYFYRAALNTVYRTRRRHPPARVRALSVAEYRGGFVAPLWQSPARTLSTLRLRFRRFSPVHSEQGPQSNRDFVTELTDIPDGSKDNKLSVLYCYSLNTYLTKFFSFPTADRVKNNSSVLSSLSTCILNPPDVHVSLFWCFFPMFFRHALSHRHAIRTLAVDG